MKDLESGEDITIKREEMMIEKEEFRNANDEIRIKK